MKIWIRVARKKLLLTRKTDQHYAYKDLQMKSGGTEGCRGGRGRVKEKWLEGCFLKTRNGG